jgi:hypothetical protein
MLGHVTQAWGIFVGCVGFVFRVAVCGMCFHAMIESKPQRKRRSQYSGPPLSLQAQRDQSSDRACDTQGVLFP